LKKKITYILSNVHKSVAFEWIVQNIDLEKIDLQFILLNEFDTELEQILIASGIKVNRVYLKHKTNIPTALVKVIFLLVKNRPNVIHAHLFEGSLIGLFAGWLLRIRKRIYTRHHSDFHHDFFPHAVKYDKLCNFLATDIIAISHIVHEVLLAKELVNETKIKMIHHGFKLEQFNHVDPLEIQSLKSKYQIGEFYPIVGVVSRYTEWKGIQFIIPAFKRLLLEYPNAKLVLANAQGDYEIEIKKMLQEIPSKNYLEIKFESNLFALFKLFDVFVHVPYDKYFEAFGQVYIEALSASIPSIFTLSGIATEFIIHDVNAKVVAFRNSDEIYSALRVILEDEVIRNRIVKNGFEIVNEKFQIHKMIAQLEKLYLE
jgi:glycosyltransferase involved in cell wall biosynthesis